MSLFNIKIDFDKSQGSFIYDKITKREYLDFMGMYSSLPLGYNHKTFDNEDFKKDVERASKLKIVNCEILSDEFDKFFKSFKDFTSLGVYKNYHFTCTGGLANEAAVKTAMWHKGPQPEGKIISLVNSFHGINSVGNFLTSRFPSVRERLGDIFKNYYNEHLHASSVEGATKLLKVDKVQGVIIEPIQSTFGDNYLDKKELKRLHKECKKRNIPLIFDEIQTGFCVTGKTWYFEHLEMQPDIVVFGKKSQVSGIMVKGSHSEVFEMPKKLSVTFDGDLLDMIRCHYIMKAIEEEELRDNATKMGDLLASGLSKINEVENIRSKGLLIAFDLESKLKRDQLSILLHKKGMLCNPTGDKSIRLRPNLAVTEEECEKALKLVSSTASNLT